MAAESLRAPASEPPQPQTAPTAPAAIESPAAPVPAPAVAPSAAEAVEGSPSGQPDEDPEPSPEELATLGDAGRRALDAERTKRRAAREEVKSLQGKIAELEARLQAVPAPPTPPVAPSAPDPAVIPPTPNPPAVPQNLMECQTFDQVDAVTMTALQAKTTATELMLALNANDRTAVVERLKAEGVTALRGQPVDQVDDATLRSVIVHAQSGAEMTLLQAPQRKAALRSEAISFTEAQKLLPGLNQAGSPDFNAFKSALDANPAVRNLGPNWPLLLAQNVAFHLGRTKTATAPTPPPAGGAVPAAAAATPPTPPTPRPAPSAPRASAAALPPKSELDEVRARLNSGKGTTADMERYARLSMG